VVAPDGATPVAGASVTLTVVPSAKLVACAGASSCTLLSDESGEVSSYITPPTAGVFSITAALAPASYVNPQRVFGTLSATSSSLDIAFTNSYRWVAQGASFDMPLTVRVVSNGSPVVGRNVDFSVMAGSASVVPSTVIADAQ